MGKSKDNQFEKCVEEIITYNFCATVMLRNIADVIGTFCLTLEEWCMLKQIADNAIKRMVSENLIPKGITESDLRSMLPDGIIQESQWKIDLLKKFNRVV